MKVMPSVIVVIATRRTEIAILYFILSARPDMFLKTEIALPSAVK
jgi:hypothetical protein